MKQRHGCLTAWLVLMIIVNALVGVIYMLAIVAGDASALGDVPGWVLPVLSVGSVLNVVFAVALLRWKMWGFVGFAAMAGLVFVVNLAAGQGVGASLMGLVGIAVLYGVLRIGDTPGWDQLD
jgi:hypothetical protein